MPEDSTILYVATMWAWRSPDSEDCEPIECSGAASLVVCGPCRCIVSAGSATIAPISCLPPPPLWRWRCSVARCLLIDMRVASVAPMSLAWASCVV